MEKIEKLIIIIIVAIITIVVIVVTSIIIMEIISTIIIITGVILLIVKLFTWGILMIFGLKVLLSILLCVVFLMIGIRDVWF
jgi:hypothetical protein